MTAANQSDFSPITVIPMRKQSEDGRATWPGSDGRVEHSDSREHLLDGGLHDAPIALGTLADEPAFRQLRAAIRELISTEITYVKTLRELEQGYLVYLRKEEKLDQTVIDVIFGRIPALRSFHGQLAASLSSRQNDLASLAETFLQQAERMQDLYTDFCIHYPESENALKEAQANHSTLWSKLTVLQKAMGHLLPISTYLLTPVQRILRYQLMLKECIKHCTSAELALAGKHGCSDATSDEDGTPGDTSRVDLIPLINWLQEAQPILHRALTRMAKIADYINEQKRNHELLERLRSDQLLKVDKLGDLVLAGHFRVRGKRGTRLILLFYKALVLCKSTTSSSASSTANPGGSSPLTGSTDPLRGAARATEKARRVPSLQRVSVLSSVVGGSQQSTRKNGSNYNSNMSQHGRNNNSNSEAVIDVQEIISTLLAACLQVKHSWCREIKRLILDNHNTTVPERAKKLVINGFQSQPDECAETREEDRQRIRERSRRRISHTSGHRNGFKSETAQNDASRRRRGRSVEPVLAGITSPIPSDGLTSPQGQTTRLNQIGISTPNRSIRDRINSISNDTVTKMSLREASTLSAPKPPTRSSSSSFVQLERTGRETSPGQSVQDGEADLDYRCITVEVNEERFDSAVPQMHNRPAITSRLNHSVSGSSLSGYTTASSPRNDPKSTKTYESTLYIDYPDPKGTGDSDLFARTYEQYISKIRDKSTLSTADLDTIFFPLHRFSTDSMASSRAPSGGRECPFFYRNSSPKDRQLSADAMGRTERIPMVGGGEAVVSASSSPVHSSHSSSGDSSPRQVVSRIAVHQSLKKPIDRNGFESGCYATRQMQPERHQYKSNAESDLENGSSVHYHHHHRYSGSAMNMELSSRQDKHSFDVARHTSSPFIRSTTLPPPEKSFSHTRSSDNQSHLYNNGLPEVAMVRNPPNQSSRPNVSLHAKWIGSTAPPASDNNLSTRTAASRMKSQPPADCSRPTKMTRKKARAPSPPLGRAPLAQFEAPTNPVSTVPRSNNSSIGNAYIAIIHISRIIVDHHPSTHPTARHSNDDYSERNYPTPPTSARNPWTRSSDDRFHRLSSNSATNETARLRTNSSIGIPIKPPRRVLRGATCTEVSSLDVVIPAVPKLLQWTRSGSSDYASTSSAKSVARVPPLATRRANQTTT